jgi:DNA (cytosine-5)-methyltransferase 1
MKPISVVDMFCGVGGLTHGLFLEGFNVVAGIDADDACEYAYEKNNGGARFIHRGIEKVKAQEILNLFPKGHIRVLVGCAPCQPYSRYTKKRRDITQKWRLLSEFADLVYEVEPDIVSMENVPELVGFKKGSVYQAFVGALKSKGYYVTEYPDVYCPDYGIPQYRTRLILFASRFSEIQIIEPTHSPKQYKTVRQTIGHLHPLSAGQVSKFDPLHRSSKLSELNLRRIQASLPGGSWKDWPESLVAACHKRQTGKHYASVYGRMSWDEPAPTITTQCYGFGNGRFGHPDQDRAISLREAALLQTFPEYYEFALPEGPYLVKTIGMFIGNAVPVELGRVIGKSIQCHLSAQ